MKKHCDNAPDWEAQRMKIIGLGESSIRKSYFPELQQKHAELEKKNEELQAAYEELSTTIDELRSNYEHLSKKEQELGESEERYRTLIETTDTGFVIIDAEGRVIDANQKYVSLTGHRELREIYGRKVTEWTALHERKKNEEAIRRCLDEGYIRNFEIDYTGPQGVVIPVEINATTIAWGESHRIITLCRDITERRRYLTALEQSRKKLNLLNTVTFQDIQGAAFSLAGFHELMMKNLTDEGPKSFLEKEVPSIRKIIDSLNFARNYQDMGINPPKWQNVHQTFLFAISHLDFLSLSRNICLDDLEIYADPLLEKIFYNLMENVLVHGERATGVHLHFSERPDGLMLFIEDNGIGIPREEKDMIFDRGHGKNRGLGLFLVREILSITGISIKETGIYGTGARFEMLVPGGVYRFPGRTARKEITAIR